MKKLLTLLAAAAGILTIAPQATANDCGRTVCVLRQGPVAINAAPRIFVDAAPVRYLQRPANYSYGQYGYNPWMYGSNYSAYNYGQFNCNPYGGGACYGGNYFGGTRYGGSYGRCLQNGYVGGLRNLPSIVIQIPHTFGKCRSR
jgi:hypothetical protein